jgi:hypothetical protein
LRQLPSSSSSTTKNPYLPHPDTDGDPEEDPTPEELEKREEGPWMIPTQPVDEASSAPLAGANVKGKKRAREEEEEEEEEKVVEYDPVAGTRFGVPVRYQEGPNLPEELAKCKLSRSILSLFRSY